MSAAIMTAVDEPNKASPFKEARTFSTYPGITQDISDIGKYRRDGDGPHGTTELPPTSEFGGVEGSDDPRGLIVPGQKFKMEGDAFVAVGKNEVPSIDVVRGRKAPAPLPIQQPLKGRKTRQRRNEEALDQILQSAPPEVPFTMSGAFGSYEGSCLKVIETDKTIVVVRTDKQAGFTPPVSGDLFALSSGGNSWEVVNFGVSFKFEETPGMVRAFTVFFRKPKGE